LPTTLSVSSERSGEDLFMRFVIVTLVTIALGLVFITPARAEKGVKKNTNGEHTVRGVVTSVEHDKKGHGSFVITTHAGKKKNAAAAAGQGGQAGKQHTVKVSNHTKFEGATAGNGANAIAARARQTVGFGQLKTGKHVTVTMKGDTAEKVVVHHPRGKKKNT
jgi:hypothetical protein